jgi:hypothetical protein
VALLDLPITSVPEAGELLVVHPVVSSETNAQARADAKIAFRNLCRCTCPMRRRDTMLTLRAMVKKPERAINTASSLTITITPIATCPRLPSGHRKPICVGRVTGRLILLPAVIVAVVLGRGSWPKTAPLPQQWPLG